MFGTGAAGRARVEDGAALLGSCIDLLMARTARRMKCGFVCKRAVTFVTKRSASLIDAVSDLSHST